MGALLAHELDRARRGVRPQQHAGVVVWKVSHMSRAGGAAACEQARVVSSVSMSSAAAVHLEDQVGEDGVSAAGSAWPGAAAGRTTAGRQSEVERVFGQGCGSRPVTCSALQGMLHVW